MNYWLLKSEPNVWSIDQQLKVGAKGADWDGVRNYQAANNLKKMKKGDLCKLKTPVSLENIKKNKDLKDIALIKQSRLSVMPIDTKCWKIILKMSSI